MLSSTFMVRIETSSHATPSTTIYTAKMQKARQGGAYASFGKMNKSI